MRQSELSRRLIGPPVVRLDGDDRRQVRDRLRSELGRATESLPPGRELAVSLPTIRRARIQPELLSVPEEPFGWKPMFSRRSLGLAAVSACHQGRFRTPSEAVGPVAAEAVAAWERTGWRTFHWEPWMAGLAPGARAMVLAEAATWATALWSMFDWRMVGPLAQFGGEEDQWVYSDGRTVRLKARPEVRLPLVGSQSQSRFSGGERTALVSLSGGGPGDGWEQDLAYLALVATLRSPTRPIPGRVMGIWPDAGQHRIVEIDQQGLMAGVDCVVATVRAVLDARHSKAGG